NMQKRQQAKMEAEFAKLSSENKAQSDAFLAQNRAKAGVQTVPGSTVQYRVVENGSGAKPTQASDVQRNYKGSLPDGTVFVDTAQAQEGQQAGPVTMKISQIPLVGLREALLQMPAGARWEVVLPGDKAYGTDMRAGRMANQAVVFDVKLVSGKRREAARSAAFDHPGPQGEGSAARRAGSSDACRVSPSTGSRFRNHATPAFRRRCAFWPRASCDIQMSAFIRAIPSP